MARAPAAFLVALAAALLSRASAGPKSKRPPRVAREAPRSAWGGGSADTPGHGRPMQEQPGASPLEEVTEEVPWATFYERYIRGNRPVVLRGAAAQQRAFTLWTDEYLTRHWGSKTLSVELNKTESRGGKTLQMPLKKFVGEIYKESRQGELYAIIDFDDDDRAKADFDFPAPANCKETLLQSVTLWMSSGGTTSVLHQDDAENFLILLAGKKSVMLVHQDQAQNLYAPIAEHRGSSPVHQESVDLVAFPRFANVSWIQGDVAAGDILYIPHTYWHQVNSFGRNLAVNLWWQHKDDWRWWDPQNDNEYNAVRFGEPGRMAFDYLKSRGPASLPCTPPAAGSHLGATRMMDEGKFKHYATKKREKARRKGEL